MFIAVPEDSIELPITPAFALRGYLHTPAFIIWSGKSRPGYLFTFWRKIFTMEDFYTCYFLDLILCKFRNTTQSTPPIMNGM